LFWNIKISVKLKWLYSFGVTTINVFAGAQLKDFLSEKDQLQPVFPLGATDLRLFKGKCTGCMLCASKCPSKIIISSTGAFDSSPIVPVLNFQNNYCLEDCIVHFDFVIYVFLFTTCF